jgi:DNA (cytosine-5)-methyltransferase 1
MLTHFSLFTGIGGIDLAAEWAGFQTVGQCEYADYPTRVLEKHWPEVPRWRDVKDVTAVSVFEQTGFRPGTITLVSGGDPCQPHSQSGKRRGKDDDRYLWPEMFTVISELRPTWVINENVSGSRSNMVVDQKISDLESIGYEVAPPLNVPACAAGAEHERRRIFVIAHSNSEFWETRLGIIKNRAPAIFGNDRELRQEIRISSFDRKSRRMDGISGKVDRYKCLGNAVMPQHIYPVLKAIAGIEQLGGGQYG